jgi:hypothetical protein
MDERFLSTGGPLETLKQVLAILSTMTVWASERSRHCAGGQSAPDDIPRLEFYNQRRPFHKSGPHAPLELGAHQDREAIQEAVGNPNLKK